MLSCLIYITFKLLFLLAYNGTSNINTITTTTATTAVKLLMTTLANMQYLI